MLRATSEPSSLYLPSAVSLITLVELRMLLKDLGPSAAASSRKLLKDFSISVPAWAAHHPGTTREAASLVSKGAMSPLTTPLAKGSQWQKSRQWDVARRQCRNNRAVGQGGVPPDKVTGP